MKLDRDGQLAVPESDVERTCVEWLLLRWPGAQYIRTNASDLRRSGAPAFPLYTLDGLFVHPRKPALFVEWKARRARTARRRREGQAATSGWLDRQGYIVIQMEDGLPNPVGWFIEKANEW